jgi:hypothetical protein
MANERMKGHAHGRPSFAGACGSSQTRRTTSRPLTLITEFSENAEVWRSIILPPCRSPSRYDDLPYQLRAGLSTPFSEFLAAHRA